jgi:Xaa-Pro aminopeptidase
MSVVSERITTAISTNELERRWAAVRHDMRQRKIDALVMQNANDWLGGYVKWFTDLPATNGYPKTVVFHADEPMTLIEMGGFGVVRKLKGGDPVHRGIDEVIGSPSFLSVNYTDNYHADCALATLKPRGYRTIGLVAPGSMPHAFITSLKEGLADAAFVDATDWLDLLKAIKSEEEIALIRRCAQMQDAVFA